MNFIYLLISDKSDWEDLVVFISEEDAIEISKKYPNKRVEIFSKNENKSGYTPTYNFYQNGIYNE